MYASRALTEEEKKTLYEFKGQLIALESKILETMPKGRELSMVITKLDEAMLWFGTALASQEPNRKVDTND